MTEEKQDFIVGVREKNFGAHFNGGGFQKLGNAKGDSGVCKILNLPTVYDRLMYLSKEKTWAACKRKLKFNTGNRADLYKVPFKKLSDAMARIAKENDVPVDWLIGTSWKKKEQGTPEPVEQPEKSHPKETAEDYSYNLTLNGKYDGQTVRALMGGLLSETQYEVNISIKGE